MAIEESIANKTGRRLRLGMVGGGQGAFIGAVHRLAARMDDHYELVAGALSSDPARAQASAAELRISPDRAYGSYQEMAKAEAARDDGIDVVAIVTPNHVHFDAAKVFLEAGIHVVCDKPLTTTSADAMALVALGRKTGLVFGLTHNYTGYPMVRQAREMVKAGDLGAIRVVQVEYAQDWLSTKIEDTGLKQAEWRTDPARSGAGGCIGDIGTHAYNLAHFITDLELDSLSADLSTFVEGRQLDDNVHIMMRYVGGARGMLWSSQVAPGNENGLRIRVYGEKAGLSWSQEDPNYLQVTKLGEPPQLITRGGSGSSEIAGHATRIHQAIPKVICEGFANIYTDVAEVISARLENREPNPMATTYPSVEDGARGVVFIEAAVRSSSENGQWVDAKVAL